MQQKYKVYFANRPVIFSQSNNAIAAAQKHCARFLSKGKLDTLAIESAIANGAREIHLECPDPMASWKSFAEQFEFVQAAGGLVVNSEGEILFIFRNGKWDLPKGKVENGESLEQAAVREVEEECGIGLLQIASHLLTTWHTYIQQGEHMLKATDWYVMHHRGQESAVPQLEEGITETRWLSLQEMHIVKANTYPSVLDVVEAYMQQLS
jgi:8-oxo-dGTP pyrophosphatase MutT (NUDIX family)